MSTISRKRAILTIIIHCIFWALVFIFYVYYFGYHSSDLYYVLGFVSFLMPVTILSAYYINYYLIPRFLLVRRYLKFTLYAVYTFIITTYLVMVSIFLAFIFLADYYYDNMSPLSRNYLFIFVGVFLVIFLATALRQLHHAYQVQGRNGELQKLMLEADLKLKTQELQYLKSQVHPHFLFNMLNTLYGMALRKDDQSPATILRLSNLLDYILYRVNQPHVTLGKELEHLIDYVELEKLRAGDRISVEIKADTADHSFVMAPLLLIPFVENSFKHGSYLDGNLEINVEVETNEDGLLFNIKNSSKARSQNHKEGIGIMNIKRRLELIYPQNHNLEIRQLADWFEVNLAIGRLDVNRTVEEIS
ncbi:sensor histidine kinase [Fulvivirga sediminis]|uniref:Histidine kinase n=1 Tax=Fulvivirga sediminis TaxID=2803949 RepID=A0A937FCS8_9BACT|nr:histidine kinase [Fulvivirga sediminis]MBL3658053.1 histidine kinase [Fulvivirga sediminis]